MCTATPTRLTVYVDGTLSISRFRRRYHCCGSTRTDKAKRWSMHCTLSSDTSAEMYFRLSACTVYNPVGPCIALRTCIIALKSLKTKRRVCTGDSSHRKVEHRSDEDLVEVGLHGVRSVLFLNAFDSFFYPPFAGRTPHDEQHWIMATILNHDNNIGS